MMKTPDVKSEGRRSQHVSLSAFEVSDRDFDLTEFSVFFCDKILQLLTAKTFFSSYGLT